ncbi:hypothetical protein ABFS82_02G031000 [Erythranthe guttata]|uniref:Protein kinase domain-containing protein n=1 Tax=Erythranthe guttata TaxID=4155 RepID=A0A022RDA8_ERYGU|nr:PREDICTED: CDPK-related protein kinase-like [Erythranthe guttata]EYU37708.1 hypothetical protein MIMGU_mgv1a005157mg [Erythranthe guttata]|eukprot:XP_012836971.1 PREDICTED: CDPK-related protein kinase-like [Erythranthe guttata]
MGIVASKKPPPKPNPYARRDPSEYSNPPPTTTLTPSAAAAAEEKTELDKRFGFSTKFASRFEIMEEVRQGHFGYTCSAIAKKGELKGHKITVKIIPKSKITTAIAIEAVRREVEILRVLTGHPNTVQFYDAYEDVDNVYLVTELCEGEELLDKIIRRNEKYSEDNAKEVIVQILNVVAFCHLQCIVHCDIKPENFIFTSKDENSELKAIDFGLSVFLTPDEKLTEIVGSAYYVAPEILQRSYGREADIWSTGVIAYILLCGTRPFREVTKADPSFEENDWVSVSCESKDFVRRLLCEDPMRRITAAQALCHPWLRNHVKVKLPIDVLILTLMKEYMRSSSLRKAALRALSKTLTEDELFYLKEQFSLLCPDANGGITLQTIKMALTKNATAAVNGSRVLDFLDPLNALQYRRMYFGEFCTAAISVRQMDALDNWEKRARSAYDIFEKDGNRAIVIHELASELGLSPSVPVHTVLREWIRHGDGKLNFHGFVKLLH